MMRETNFLPKQAVYRTTNWSKYNHSLKMRGNLTVWIDKDLEWQAKASGKRGGQKRYSDEAIQACLELKCLLSLPLRQTIGLMESLMSLANLQQELPDFSTLSRRQKTLSVSLPYSRSSSEGLHLLVDSTGIKFLGEGEQKRKQYGAEYKRQWRKVHLGIDADTLQIRAVMMTDNSLGDATILPDLLEQISADEGLTSVTADGAYDTKACHKAIADRGANPIIPPRKNAKLWKKPNNQGEINRNEAVKARDYLGVKLWKQWSGYHRRSLVETKMHCFKLLGERLKARTFERQNTELHIRVAILNKFTKLGNPVTIRA
jgi:Transposase DDE domain